MDSVIFMMYIIQQRSERVSCPVKRMWKTLAPLNMLAPYSFQEKTIENVTAFVLNRSAYSHNKR